MVADYVSPFDDRVRPTEPIAPRLSRLAGARITLLDIRKNRGAEFLDRIEALLRDAGAVPLRAAKEIFSKPADLGLIDRLVTVSDAVIEALAD